MVPAELIELVSVPFKVEFIDLEKAQENDQNDLLN